MQKIAFIKILIKSLFGLILACLYCMPIFANLSASPIVMEFIDGKTNRKDITLSNTGKYTKYLEVSALRITNIGEYPEIYSADPDPDKVGLLVAPRRLVLKPGEEKIIRVIRIKKSVTSDEAWRVHIRPAKVEMQAKSTGVMAQIAYMALVFVRPENNSFELTNVREGRHLTITNQGNTNILLHDGEQCMTDRSECKKITGKRLWPGKSWSVELPLNAPVIFQTLSQSKKGNVTF